MKLLLKKGSTSKLIHVWVPDSSSGTGAGLTGLVHNSAGLTAYYYREGAASAASISLVDMTVGTWTSGGFKAVDGTNMPGLYQVGLPDAALASGANSVVVLMKGATNMAPVVLEIQLTDVDLHDAVRGGMTALPNAAAAATGGLPTVDASNAVKVQSGTGANQISLSSGQVTVATNNDKSGYALTTGERNSIADALLDRDMSAGTDSGSPSFRTPRQALRALRNRFGISGTTRTVYKEDDTTASWTSTLVTDAAAVPIVGDDPAGP